MSKHNIAHLSRVAAAATQGEWEAIIHKGPKDGNLWHAQSPNRLQRYAKCDAEYLQDMTPDTAQALLQALREARAALEKIEQEPNEIGPDADELVEDWGIKSWNVAHEALANLDANFDFTEESKP